MASLLFQRTANGDLYPINLGAILMPGMRVWDPSYALSRDPEVWEKAQQDAVISGSIERSLLATAGHSWVVQPHSEDEADVIVAGIMTDLIRQIPRFTEARRNLAEARFMGSAFAQITGDFRTDRIYDGQPRRWWVPGRLIDIDRRRIHAVAESEEYGQKASVYFRWKLYSPSRHQWEWLDPDFPLVKHVYCDNESRLGYGRGIMDSIYYGTYIRGVAMKDGLQGLKRWAQGLLIGRVDRMAPGRTNQTTETIRDEMKDTLLEMIGDNVLIIDKDDNVEVVTGGMEGHQIVDSILDRVERELITRIEGSPVSTMDGEGGGSRALSQTQSGREHAQRHFDRDSEAEALTYGLVHYTFDMNREVLAEIDPRLARAHPGRFDIRDQRVEDPGINADVAQKMLQSGAKIRKKEYYERVGWQQPEKDDQEEDLLQPPQPAAPGGAPGGGGMDLQSMLGAAAREGMEAVIRALAQRSDAETFRRIRASLAGPPVTEAVGPKKRPDLHGAEWDEAKHPRGQPGNAGQFGSGGSKARRTQGGADLTPTTAAWIDAWQYRKQQGEPTIDDEQIAELAPYVPKDAVVLYRAEREGGPGKASLLSWTREEDLARHIAENEPGRRVIHRRFWPNEILVDLKMLPNAKDNIDEVIVAKGPMLKRLQAIRKNSPKDIAPGAFAAAEWDESLHPRDDHGRFVSKDDLDAARSDPAKAEELRSRVTDPEQRRKLEEALRGPGREPESTGGRPAGRDARIPNNGEVIRRTWRGVEYEVTVSDEGFTLTKGPEELLGKTHPTLTSLAKAVTGAKSINGVVWFGLGKKEVPGGALPTPQPPASPAEPPQAPPSPPTPPQDATPTYPPRTVVGADTWDGPPVELPEPDPDKVQALGFYKKMNGGWENADAGITLSGPRAREVLQVFLDNPKAMRVEHAAQSALRQMNVHFSGTTYTDAKKVKDKARFAAVAAFATMRSQGMTRYVNCEVNPTINPSWNGWFNRNRPETVNVSATHKGRRVSTLADGESPSRPRPWVWGRDGVSHTWVHEVGHKLHYENHRGFYIQLDKQPTDLDGSGAFPWAINDKMKQRLKQGWRDHQISGYGSTSPHEFVAEMFSRKVHGWDVADDLMEVYRELGGKELPGWSNPT